VLLRILEEMKKKQNFLKTALLGWGAPGSHVVSSGKYFTRNSLPAAVHEADIRLGASSKHICLLCVLMTD